LDSGQSWTVAALDQKNVIWVGDMPQCPHCRNEVLPFATVCISCDHAFDWKTHEKPCTACLSPRDARYFLHLYQDKQDAFRAALLKAGIEEELLPGFIEYAESLKSGACGFCGGSGEWLAPGHQERTSGDVGITELYPILRESMSGKCPVCLGTGRCVLCDGDRLVEYGRESADRDFYTLSDRWDHIDPLRDDRSAETRFLLLSTYMRSHRGRGEIAYLQSFDQGNDLHLDRARQRLKFITELLTALP